MSVKKTAKKAGYKQGEYDKKVRSNSNSLKQQGSKKVEYEQPKHNRSNYHRGMQKTHKKHLNKNQSVFGELTDEEYELINSFSHIIDDALMLKDKQKRETFKAIRALFQELTSERESKNIDYLSEPIKLSAYIYYYLWWNLLRFVRLFNGLSLNIKTGDIIGDFGSGPLTFVLALWIAKPELRECNLTFYCMDISERAMKAGEKIFHSLVAFSAKYNKIKENVREDEKKGSATIARMQELKWKIKRVASPFGTPLKEKLDFFFSANMFNEICWKNMKILKIYAEKQARMIDSYLKSSSSVLIIEPGLPIGGKIISIFRAFFLQQNDYSIVAPCPHTNFCPLHERLTSADSAIIKGNHSAVTGRLDQLERHFLSLKGKRDSTKFLSATARGKWCHFTFSTLNSPSSLLSLSEKVHLEKKTASLSYLYCTKNEKQDTVSAKTETFCNSRANVIEAIITSNIIKLSDGKFGFYACSSFGFLLLKTVNRALLRILKSGAYVSIDASKVGSVRDKKSGALIVDMN